MANEKFTPGPWKIDDYEDYDLCAIITGADGELVETVYTGKPNASLIAAAPDLYAASEQVREDSTMVERDGKPMILISYAAFKSVCAALDKAVPLEAINESH